MNTDPLKNRQTKRSRLRILLRLIVVGSSLPVKLVNKLGSVLGHTWPITNLAYMPHVIYDPYVHSLLDSARTQVDRDREKKWTQLDGGRLQRRWLEWPALFFHYSTPFAGLSSAAVLLVNGDVNTLMVQYLFCKSCKGHVPKKVVGRWTMFANRIFYTTEDFYS